MSYQTDVQWIDQVLKDLQSLGVSSPSLREAYARLENHFKTQEPIIYPSNHKQFRADKFKTEFYLAATKHEGFAEYENNKNKFCRSFLSGLSSFQTRFVSLYEDLAQPPESEEHQHLLNAWKYKKNSAGKSNFPGSEKQVINILDAVIEQQNAAKQQERMEKLAYS